MIRCMDYNDIYWKQDPSHPSDIFPAAMAGCFLAMVSSFMAYTSLKKGATDYWPRAERGGLKEFQLERAASDA